MSNKILVIGSSGKTGSRVYNKLQQKGIEPVPASRRTAIPFDWYNEQTWAASLQGIGSAYVTFQPDLAVPGSLEIITRFTQAAITAGVQKLVLLSGRGEHEAMACEKVIIQSGLDWTILRASFFMQNFSEGFWAESIVSGEFVVPLVKAKEPFVDVDDIAEVAVEALLHDRHNHKIYELTGPQLLSFGDTIAEISAALKKDIKLVELPIAEYAAILRDHQLPEEMIWLITYLFTEVLDGRNESVKHDIELVLHRKPRSFKEYVQKAFGLAVKPSMELS